MRALAFIVFIFICFNLSSQELTSVRVEINLGEGSYRDLIKSEIYPLHGFYKKNGLFTGEFDSNNFSKLKNSKFKYEILIDDLDDYYKNSSTRSTQEDVVFHSCFNRAKDYPVPQGFELGSVGGFYTFQEYLAEIDSMIANYPNLISTKEQIGNSYEARPIYSLKISDNPNVDEDEPEVLYTAIHHSQEPASLQQLIYYMYYLLENYGANEEVTYLIDNTELYFIPVINPDGYVYNMEDGEAGGLHRKNRHTTTFSDGVDLNRNYDWEYGYDNIGSSNIGFHPWHRGDSAFSEPETRAVKEFLENREILIDLNWHSYGDMIIYPWNYENHYTEDSLLYEKIGEILTYENNFRFGTVYETYGYQSNGDADDWGYGEVETKNKIISLTGEIGNMDDGFWPDTSRIIPLCKKTVRMNLNTAHFAHSYHQYTDLSSELIASATGYFKFKLQSVGLDTSANYIITFTPLTQNITLPYSYYSFENMNNMQSKHDSVEYIINAESGEEVAYVVSVNTNLYVFRDTIRKVFGDVEEIFYDNCETLQNWTGNDWNISYEKSFSGTYSITESPYQNYDLLQESELELDYDIDLSTTTHAVIEFMMRYDLENNYDYVQLYASVDTGNNWEPLCGKNSRPGTDDQEHGMPIYDGAKPNWIYEELSLNNYIGESSVKLKFYFYSDQSTTREGFYFDDFKIRVIDPNLTDIKSYGIINNGISLYPNPTTGQFNIRTGYIGRNLTIYNLQGEKVYFGNIKKNNMIIDLSTKDQGLYLYKIEGVDVSGKIIIE